MLFYVAPSKELEDAGLSKDGGAKEEARIRTAHMDTFSQRMPRIILYKLGVPKQYLRGYEEIADGHLPERWWFAKRAVDDGRASGASSFVA